MDMRSVQKQDRGRLHLDSLPVPKETREHQEILAWQPNASNAIAACVSRLILTNKKKTNNDWESTQRSPSPGLIFRSPSHSRSSVGSVSMVVIGGGRSILRCDLSKRSTGSRRLCYRAGERENSLLGSPRNVFTLHFINGSPRDCKTDRAGPRPTQTYVEPTCRKYLSQPKLEFANTSSEINSTSSAYKGP